MVRTMASPCNTEEHAHSGISPLFGPAGGDVVRIGSTRRGFLQTGLGGLAGLSVPAVLKSQALAAANGGGAKKPTSVILFWLSGGPSHIDMWDPKPDAPSGIRGPWDPASTSVPGTFITEKMPLLARVMDKVAIVRSWKGDSAGHSQASTNAMSGVLPRGNNEQYFPNFGCVASALLKTRASGVAPYVGLPVAARYTVPSGYLGPAYGAFDVDGDPSADDFQIDGLIVSTRN